MWSYPVGTDTPGFTPTREWVNDHISNEQVIMNMVNSLLGRIHLASHLELLSEQKLDLIAQGLAYYDGMIDFKKTAVPYMPLELTRFGNTLVASGLKDDGKLLLAVWNLGGERDVTIPLSGIAPKSVRIAYPASPAYAIPCSLQNGALHVSFTEDNQARMLEIAL